MYKLYYDYDLVAEYLECYLIDSLMFQENHELSFIHITTDHLNQIKLYKQCNKEYLYSVYLVNTINLIPFNYTQFLHLYDIMKPWLWTIGEYKQVLSDLELIFINWNVD